MRKGHPTPRAGSLKSALSAAAVATILRTLTMKGLLLLALSSLLCWVSGKHLGPQGPGSPCPTATPHSPRLRTPSTPGPKWLSSVLPASGLPVTGSWLHSQGLMFPPPRPTLLSSQGSRSPFPSPRCPLLGHPNTGSPASPTPVENPPRRSYLLPPLRALGRASSQSLPRLGLLLRPACHLLHQGLHAQSLEQQPSLDASCSSRGHVPPGTQAFWKVPVTS